jgi:hypothetical protein
MTLPRTAADVLSRHVLFEIESIDRLYLNLYVPSCSGSGRWSQYVGRRIPACGDCSQYANAVADVVGLHRRGRRPGVLWGDPNAQYAGADPEADRRVEFDGFAVDTQRDGLCGVDLERRGRPLSQQ